VMCDVLLMYCNVVMCIVNVTVSNHVMCIVNVSIYNAVFVMCVLLLRETFKINKNLGHLNWSKTPV